MRRIQRLLLLCACLVQVSMLCAFPFLQVCEIPLITKLHEATNTSIMVEWSDFNSQVSYWELELLEFGDAAEGEPTITSITDSKYLLEDLEAASRYTLFIRAICPAGPSEWNGPYNLTTNLDKDHYCGIEFPIDDDNCPETNIFYFQNEIDGQLGKSLFLEEIDITIEHNWPSDLRIKLISPSGKNTNLISHLGINSQHLGEPDDACEQTFGFSDRACEDIKDAPFPLRGSYRPELSLENLYDGSEGAGAWGLEICDRAESDVGVLRHFNLTFSQGSCYPPGEIIISKVAGTFIELEWDNPSCEELEIVFGPLGFDPSQASIRYVSCADQFFRITGLEKDTEYEFRINTVCLDKTFDADCGIFLSTECANPSLDIDFDDMESCSESCDAICDLNNFFWKNIETDDLEWLVNRGETPTAFTGPEADIKGNGKYLYVDASTSTCGPTLLAQIESTCLSINSTADGCDLSFFYIMHGVDVGSLRVEISIDDGAIFETIWETQGNQGRIWQKALIDLGAYDDQLGIFRITVETGDGNFGDIAIDDLKLYNSLVAIPLNQYYADKDLDGYGDPNEELFYCSLVPPAGYVKNKTDCDDTNPFINPGIAESPCNLIDDNCDEDIDEFDANSLSLVESNVMAASCNGNLDASIALEVEGGIPPYSYEWSNGDEVNPLVNVDPGIYHCTVTDQSGCVLITDFIAVQATENLVYVIDNLTNNSCEGKNEGMISIIVDGGLPPYEYEWSNGAETRINDQLKAGLYVVTVTDALNCNIISEPISLKNANDLLSGVANKRDLSCFEVNDGELLVSASNGNGSYSYDWSHGASGNNIENLAAGYYSYVVSDESGCQLEVDSILITQPKPIEIQIDALEANICNSENEGIILTTAVGGTAPYSFFWSNGETVDDIRSLENGSYSLLVSDANGCSTRADNIQINSPPLLELSLQSISHETCRLGNDGQIWVEATGGMGNYSYNWSNGGDNNSSIDELSSGIYSLTVIDDFGCKAVLSNMEILEENIDLSINVNVVEDLDCFGEVDGEISATANGGTLPYDFNWSNGSQTVGDFNQDQISSLGNGTYDLTVTDALGCTGISDEVELIEGAQILYNITEILNLDCATDNNGSIQLELSGGNPPISVNWNNGSSGMSNINLSAGAYIATLTDASGCHTITDSIYIQSPPLIQSEVQVSASTGLDDGSIELNISGGMAPYEVVLDGNSMSVNGSIHLLSNLLPGEYPIQIIDNNECILTLFVEVPMVDATFEDHWQKQFECYPNPFGDRFSLLGPIEKLRQHHIYNHLGQRFHFAGEITNDQIEFSLEEQPPGIYYLHLQGEGWSLVKKLVKL